jgi:bla regulator protein BlaR1
MTTFIIKSILCSGALFLIYYLILEREKMYRFNRFFLLFSVLFSFGVIFITITVPAPVMPVQEEMVFANDTLPVATSIQAYTPAELSNLVPNLLWGLYFAVTAFMLARFIRNLYKLTSKIRKIALTGYNGATLVLTNEKAIPHSFLNYIFIDREKFEKGQIEKEILQHELTHVRQRHSVDILLIELLIVFAWFNPLLFLFRRSMLLNHEFLADDAVVQTFNDVESYQMLLFQTVNTRNNIILSSPFNYLITKKRLIMMTRETSQKVAILKQIAIIPLIAALGFLFSTRVVAQDKPTQDKKDQVETAKPDASQSIVDEYNAIIAKYHVVTVEGRGSIGKKLSAEEKNHLGDLFMKMNRKQQSGQIIQFSPKLGPASKRIPTQDQLETWKNPKQYGLWIDGKKVDNSVLNNYTYADFDKYDWSALTGAAKFNKKYNVQVDLMTKAYYQKYLEEEKANRKNSSEKYDMAKRAFLKEELEKMQDDPNAKALLEKQIQYEKKYHLESLVNQKKELDKKQ